MSKTCTEKEERLKPGPVILALISHTFTSCLLKTVKYLFLVPFTREQYFLPKGKLGHFYISKNQIRLELQ